MRGKLGFFHKTELPQRRAGEARGRLHLTSDHHLWLPYLHQKLQVFWAPRNRTIGAARATRTGYK
jgi:hypothetical protein